MGNGMKKLEKIGAGTAVEVCGKYTQSAEILPLVTDDMTPAALMDRLVVENRLQEASRFLAHALPKREAVWWACLSAREALSEGGDEMAETLLTLAERWVRKPTDENRRAAMAAAEAAGFDSPASWAAVAAFWSGDSLGPVGLPPVGPSDGLTGTAVAAATMLAASTGDPAAMPDRFRAFLKTGMDVAKGGTGRGGEANP